MAGNIPNLRQEEDEFLYDVFPEDFQWGLAVSAYQTEGAFDVDGKGPSAWDAWTHENNGSNIVDGQNGDVACDSYNKFENDTQLLADMGANFYKISLSWPRIVPTGRTSDGINLAGIAHYNKVIDSLLAKNITPFVTLHQWDLPLPLQLNDIYILLKVTSGSWNNEEIVKNFGDFARIAFQFYGNRVDLWATLHEPLISCQADATFGVHDYFDEPPTKQYTCVHNVLKAHATAYKIFKDELGLSGQVGLTLNSEWAQPKNASDPFHVDAAERLLAFRLGWFLHPIYTGDYHPIMRSIIDQKSEAEGRNSSRLPSFDDAWKQKLIGSLDFIGLNYFFTVNVVSTIGNNGGVDGDGYFATEFDPTWNLTGDGLPITPFGMRKLLNYVKESYGSSLPIYLINGCGEVEGVDGTDDTFRVDFFKIHINECLKAVKLDGANVKGFTAWSLIDNFEWSGGYTGEYLVN
ncbi:Lactase-like protein [Folsomia candida]|uniref:Lactase-like protein n=1 Tax=Folsomia candida TaxID=158441 RepID=A0A226EDJ7_FOLCA|nr:Lactase-like protein [Folsomia candida]